jgi:DNA-binding ferritin-like protein (Dps family)
MENAGYLRFQKYSEKNFFCYGGVDWIPVCILRVSLGLSKEQQEDILEIINNFGTDFAEFIDFLKLRREDLIEIVTDKEVKNFLLQVPKCNEYLLSISQAGVQKYLKALHYLHYEQVQEDMFTYKKQHLTIVK